MKARESILMRNINLAMSELNISVVSKMITFKFPRSVLLEMCDRSGAGAFHLAILALHKTRQTLIVLSATKVTGW